jgi:hypothetical protein
MSYDSSIIQLVIKEYKSVKNIAEIARKFSLNTKTVRHWLVKNGVEIRQNSLDILGDKYGRLKVFSYKGKDTNGKSIWNCLCDCGKEKCVRASDLKSGKISSCGCLKKEVNSIIGKETIQKINKMNKAVGELSGTHYSSIRSNGSKRGFEFSVSKDFLWNLFLNQNKKCAISGVELIMSISKSKEKTASLDRIDSSKGYLEDNVQWVHKDINKMKLNHSLDKFINWCIVVADFQKSKQ